MDSVGNDKKSLVIQLSQKERTTFKHKIIIAKEIQTKKRLLYTRLVQTNKQTKLCLSFLVIKLSKAKAFAVFQSQSDDSLNKNHRAELA